MEKLGDVIKSHRKLLKLTQSDFAQAIGVGQTTVTDWETGKITQIRDWERVADFLSIPRGRFVALMAQATEVVDGIQRVSSVIREHMISPPERKSEVAIRRGRADVLALKAPVGGERDVPVFGRAQGGPDGVFEFNGEVMGWEVRPPALEGVKNAYAVYVDGESMFPRYKPGETVWINPNRPPRREDDIIVQLHPDADDEPPHGFIKEFITYAGNNLVVRQYNPPMDLKFPKERVKSIHVIVYSQRG